MITTLTITSLNQGRELARRQVEKLHAEPAEPAPQLVIEEIPASEPVAPVVRLRRPERPALLAQFLAFWNAALPIGAWRF